MSTDAEEWKVLGANESVPHPLPGYVVSFVAFNERSFSIPAG
jgi:hypothetical protein